MENENKKTPAFYYAGLLLAVAAFWGIGNPVMKIVVAEIPPLYFLVIRMVLSFLLCLAVTYKRVIPNLNRSLIKPVIAMSLPMAAAYVTSAYAMRFTTATNVGFLMSTCVIFTPILGYFFLKSKIKLKTVLDVAIVIVGIFLLSTASGSITINPGDVIAISCAFAGALMLITAKMFVCDTDPILLTVLQIGAAGIWCLVPAVFFEPFPDFGAITPEVWGNMLFMVVFCTCIALMGQNVALKHLSETYAAVIFCMEPVFGAIASFILLGEMLNARGFIGASIIMAGVLFASLVPAERKEKGKGKGEGKGEGEGET